MLFSCWFTIESVEYDSMLSYTLETMTPKNVHTGGVPQDVLDEENEYLRQLFRQENTLLKLFDTSENGMMQYKRTRPEASKDGVKAVKEILKKEGMQTQLHPLLVGMDPTRCNQSVVEKNKFVQMLQTFRPQQTVLESGIGTGCTSGQTSRQKSVQRGAPGKEVLSGEAMRAFRKVTRFSLERNKAALLNSSISNNEVDEDSSRMPEGRDDDDDDDFENDNDNDYGMGDEFVESAGTEEAAEAPRPIVTSHAPRLSKAARRKLKSGESVDALSRSYVEAGSRGGRAESSYGSEERFHDSRHFMTYGVEDDKADFMESAMQPLAGMRGSELQGMLIEFLYYSCLCHDSYFASLCESSGAAMMQKAVLDLSPEAAMAVDSSTKKKILRWDPKKRKFVKVCIFYPCILCCTW